MEEKQTESEKKPQYFMPKQMKQHPNIQWTGTGVVAGLIRDKRYNLQGLTYENATQVK